MNKYAVIVGVFVLILAGLWAMDVRVAEAPGEQACTLEAKLCLDGSAVGRTGPNCEFAACPIASATSTAGGGGSGGGGILPYNSGVRGKVLLGPMCPVERTPPDPACADRPYETAVSVTRLGSSSLFAEGKSDAKGAFEFSLPPGFYTVSAAGGAVLPRCSPVDVTVPPSGYAAATVSCDTGIRTPVSSAPTQPLQPTVTWSGTPITILFDENGASPNVISVKRYESATLILQAAVTVPEEGISFLASQSSGGAPGPVKPGGRETVTVRPARSFFYSPRSPDNMTRYPFYIRINVYN